MKFCHVTWPAPEGCRGWSNDPHPFHGCRHGPTPKAHGLKYGDVTRMSKKVKHECQCGAKK